MKKPKTNPQEGCIQFSDAYAKMDILKQPGFLVKYFKIVVVSPEGNKLTLGFDPEKFRRERNKK